MGPQQVLELWVREDLGVMAIKGILYTPQFSRIEASSSNTVFNSDKIAQC